MKKGYIGIFIIILVILVVGCQPIIGSGDEEETNNKELVIADYFPFRENTKLSYEGIGNEYAEQITFFEFIEGNRAQVKSKNTGTTVVKILEHEDGVLREIYNEAEFYHIENMINTKAEINNILIKEPIELGNSWTTEEGYTREITGLGVKIETTVDTYNALEITTDLGDNKTQKQYYAKGIGLVANIYKDNDIEIKTILKSINKGSEELDLVVFYPRLSDLENVYVNEKIYFNTNDSIEDIIRNILRNPKSEGLIPLISEGTVINSIHLDRSSWVLNIDFSEELLSELNVGSSQETEMLKALVNTLGKLYDTDKVYISVEDRPYESGHYALREGENFKVDYEGIKEFK